MSILKTKEDLLPSIGHPVSVPSTEGHAMAVMGVHDDAPMANAVALERDISGCISLIGPVQICYDINISTPSVALALKVDHITVVSGEINPKNPCITFKGDYWITKWDLKICLRDVKGTPPLPHSVTLEGKACATLWGCKEFNITIIHW